MLLDTNAWVEILLDSEKGRRMALLFENERTVTVMVSLSELASWALKNNRNPEAVVERVKAASSLLPFSEDVARLAGKIHCRFKKETKAWGMVDSIIYATALIYGFDVVTGDSDFKGKPHVRFL